MADGRRLARTAAAVAALAILVVAGCRDLGLSGRLFACRTDSDCGAGTFCHPQARVCVAPGADVLGLLDPGRGDTPTLDEVAGSGDPVADGEAAEGPDETGDGEPGIELPGGDADATGEPGDVPDGDARPTDEDASPEADVPLDAGFDTAGEVAVCVPSRTGKESCNGVDDDCNGLTDDGLTAADSPCVKLGVCGAAMARIRVTCTGGKWSACDYSDVPGWQEGSEISCDGLDNDCDGLTDDEFTYSDASHPTPVHKGAGCGEGQCADGTVVCSADGLGLACDTTQKQGSEVCDGLDNDCNGQVDETFKYDGITVYVDPKDPSKGRNACKGAGECGRFPGHVECEGLLWADCSTNPGGSDRKDTPEVCNGKDDDCDGATDEGLDDVALSPCLRDGLCAHAGAVVKASCTGGSWSCDYSGVPGFEGPKEASCDGLDNDCDGQTDEDFPVTDPDGAVHLPGQDCGTGACAGGHVVCSVDGRYALCDKAELAVPEVCDGIDNDCNGATDDGIAWRGVAVGLPCTGSGVCGEVPGVVECTASLEAVCSTMPGGRQHRDSAEKCNALDDDCDGLTDEDGAALCDDGLSCTVDVCSGGQCHNDQIAPGWCLIEGACVAGGTPEPGVACKACQPDLSPTGWTVVPEGGQCDLDGDGCTLDYCQGGACKAGLPMDCSALTGPCADGKCVAQSPTAGTCVAIPHTDGETCDTDGTGCTPEHCSGGDCVGTGPADCSGYGGVCIVGVCSSTGPTTYQCLSQPANSGTTCDDGNPCTGPDTCDGNANCRGPATPGVACDDHDLCTHDDACTGSGGCAGVAYSCGYIDECTTNLCDGQGGCKAQVDKGCMMGFCIPEGIVNPANPCQVCRRASNPTGWSNEANGLSCDDGNPCTVNDQCVSGTCTGTARTCRDTSACTTDWCDPTTPTGVDPCRHDSTCTGANPNCYPPNGCYCYGTPPSPSTCNPTFADGCSGTACRCGAGAGCDPVLSSGCISSSCRCGATLACSAVRADNCGTDGKCHCGDGLQCAISEFCDTSTSPATCLSLELCTRSSALPICP